MKEEDRVSAVALVIEEDDAARADAAGAEGLEAAELPAEAEPDS
jgi:hypothetical protein